MSKIEKLEEIIEKVEKASKKKPYEALPNHKERKRIYEFINDFGKKSSKEEKIMARRIYDLAIKFYEYYGDTLFQYKFISDEMYDILNSKMDYAGVYTKGIKKIKPVDDGLAIRMRKSYTIFKGDEVPPGIADKKSAQERLKKIRTDSFLSKNDKIEGTCKPKIDGVSMGFEIENGMIINATSRGDETAMLLKGLIGYQLYEEKSEFTDKLQVEAFITDKVFNKMKSEFGTGASKRSVMSGILKKIAANKDPEQVKRLIEDISFYPIHVLSYDFDKIKKSEERLEKYGYNIPNDMISTRIFKEKNSSVVEVIKETFVKYENVRKELSYDIDGMVVTILNKDVINRLKCYKGDTNENQFAIKFPPISGKGEFSTFIIDSGNKGVRTIKVLLKYPVLIGGHSYKVAKFKKVSEFEERTFREGDEVKFIRSGDTIPYVLIDDDCKVGSGEIIPVPEKCYCGNYLKKEDGVYVCDNPNCLGNVAGYINNLHEVLDLADFDEKFTAKLLPLIGSGSLVLFHLFKLKPEDLVKVGIKEKKAFKYVESLSKALLEAEPYKVIAGLGLKNVSYATAIKINTLYSIEELLNTRRTDMAVKLASIPGIGTKTSNSIAYGILEKRELLQFLSKRMSIEKRHSKSNPDSNIMVATSSVKPEVKNAIKSACKGPYVFTEGKNFNILVMVPDDDGVFTESKKYKLAKDAERRENSKVIYTPKEFLTPEEYEKLMKN